MHEKNVFIIGARGFKRSYGGWETFVQNLIYNWKDKNVKFYVWEIVYAKKEEGLKNYDGVICPQLYTKDIGHATLPLFCIKAVFDALKFKRKNNLDNVILYILGSRVGPFFKLMRPVFKILKIKVIVNPDGLEWKRSKWNWLVQKYWKLAEKTMVASVDCIVSDSYGITEYLNEEYKRLKTPIKNISYGTYPINTNSLIQNSSKGLDFLNNNRVEINDYYLIVGRFVPENNFEMIIKGFIKSNTKKKLLIVTNLEENSFYMHLKQETNFLHDNRIIMAGALYDKDGLSYVRYNAFAYIHGHSVGGTNPSLLEAMSTTDINLLYDVNFNKEVGQDCALYFNGVNQLKKVLDVCDTMNDIEIQNIGNKAKERMANYYSWKIVVDQHEKLFNNL